MSAADITSDGRPWKVHARPATRRLIRSGPLPAAGPGAASPAAPEPLRRRQRPGRGLLYPFRLRYPDARHRLLGLDGCGKVPDFIFYASGSAERLWKQTEDRLHDPLAALDDGTLPVSAMHQAAIKDAIALHYARSTAARIVHFRTFVQVYVARCSRRRRGSRTIETCWLWPLREYGGGESP